jgi:hypothetical protein
MNGSTLQCRAARRNLTACTAKILLTINLAIWKAVIYCTLVAAYTVTVSS